MAYLKIYVEKNQKIESLNIFFIIRSPIGLGLFCCDGWFKLTTGVRRTREGSKLDAANRRITELEAEVEHLKRAASSTIEKQQTYARMQQREIQIKTLMAIIAEMTPDLEQARAR